MTFGDECKKISKKFKEMDEADKKLKEKQDQDKHKGRPLKTVSDLGGLSVDSIFEEKIKELKEKKEYESRPKK